MNVFQIIWWSSVGLSALSIATLIFLFFRRLIIDARFARRAVTRAALQEFVYARLADPGAEAGRRFTNDEQHILLGLVTEMMRSISGPTREKLVEILEQSIDPDHIVRNLRDPRAEDRAKTAARLFWSKSPAVHAALREALNDMSPAVVIAAVNSLISARQKISLIELVPKFEARHMMGHRAVRDIFRKTAPQNIAALMALLKENDSNLVVLACDALTRARHPPALDRLAELASTHASVDVRATAIRALGLLGDTAAAPVIVAALADPAWEVKLQAAVAAGRLRLGSALPLLSALARDSNWWLQLRSAQALAQLGEAGLAVLETMRAEPDYAPVAEFALSERHG